MSKISNATFTANGSKYDFEAFTTDHDFPQTGGIYAFTRRYQQDGKFYHDILYVGKAHNLRERLSGHEKLPCVRGKNYNCVCIHADGVELSRVKKEHDLICANKPHCNEKIPDDC